MANIEELEAKLRAEIGSWDWDGIVKDAKANAQDLEDDCGGRYYLGTVMALYPSGKYWTCFAASNVDEEEQEADTLFTEILDEFAEKHGGWIESGEGDACDLFFALPKDEDE